MPKAGRRDVLSRVIGAVNEHTLSLLSAGVGFYFLLALFPTLFALLSLYGLVHDPDEARRQIAGLTALLPADSAAIIRDQLQQIALKDDATLGFSAFVSLLFGLWSAMKGTLALMHALTTVNREQETRSATKLYGSAFLLTLSGMLFVVVTLLIIAVLPTLLELLELATWGDLSLAVMRWPVLALLVAVALAALYRYAPARAEPKWRWITPGSLCAVTLWLLACGLFSWYVSSFGRFNQTYGSLGAVVVLLIWFYLTGFSFLLGATINAELEHQTKVDTTRGRPRPMGRRDAYVADHVGKSA